MRALPAARKRLRYGHDATPRETFPRSTEGDYPRRIRTAHDVRAYVSTFFFSCNRLRLDYNVIPRSIQNRYYINAQNRHILLLFLYIFLFLRTLPAPYRFTLYSEYAQMKLP